MDAIKSWQTALSSLVGFLGVCLTLAYNSWASRDLSARNKQQEARSIRIAILVELQQIIDELVNWSYKLSKLENNVLKDAQFAVSPLKTPVYDANISSIGKLTALESRCIVESYNKRTRICQVFQASSDKPDNPIIISKISSPGGMQLRAVIDEALILMVENFNLISTEDRLSVEHLHEERRKQGPALF